MIEVIVNRASHGIHEISISGHANAGAYGADIVCSAVSAVMLLFDYRLFHNTAYILYAFGLILLIGVFETKPINNTTSWYDLGPVLFQPSEPMKLFTILLK